MQGNYYKELFSSMKFSNSIFCSDREKFLSDCYKNSLKGSVFNDTLITLPSSIDDKTLVKALLQYCTCRMCSIQWLKILKSY
jgi:hypothetical protein